MRIFALVSVLSVLGLHALLAQRTERVDDDTQ